MGKKKIKPLADLTTAAGRFRHLLETLFQSNQSRMAEAIDCSQSVISKILLGQQAPGRRVMDALANHPRVNPAWLHMGVGEPIIAEKSEQPAWLLRVAKHPLPGPPADHRSLLSDDMFPVAGPFFHERRYWLEIQHQDPIASARHERIAAGDLLLIDTRQETWLEAYIMEACLCVVTTRRGKEAHAKLGVASGCFDDGGATIDTFDLGVHHKDVTKKIVTELPPGGGPPRSYYIFKHPDGTERRVGEMRVSPPLPALDRKDIVGICVMAVRRFRQP